MTPAFTQPAPVPALAPAAAPFRAVSQHDEAADESQAHRPNRRRHHVADVPPPELQLVETSFSAPVAPPAEEELPHRTKPRRRRSQVMDSEPLKLVETQPGDQQNQDGAQTP